MKLKITASFCFSKKLSKTEYYHNSSWLEYGGSPDKAVRSAFTAAFDKFLKDNNKYTKNETPLPPAKSAGFPPAEPPHPAPIHPPPFQRWVCCCSRKAEPKSEANRNTFSKQYLPKG